MIDTTSLFLPVMRGVKLGRLGMFRYSTQKRRDISKEFSYKMIHCVKLLFPPDTKFKNQLANISYEMIK